MDYEVFLLSRVREHYLATGDNDAAIADRASAHRGVITGAALMLGVVVLTFSLSQITFTKLMGVGTWLPDRRRDHCRLALVPATMKLLGRANWWRRGLRHLRGRRTIEPPMN